MKLSVNVEFLRRHLFAIAILVGMGLWFGYDGFVTYPRTPAARLYETIEKSPPQGMSEAQLEAFKAQKIAFQHGFCGILLLASAVVGLHLLAVSRLRFAFDDEGFSWKGRRYSFDAVTSVDRTKWGKKGILKLKLADRTVTLDAWHHSGVVELERLLP